MAQGTDTTAAQGAGEAPRSMEEFTARYLRNQRVGGFGLDTHMVAPCPFCGAAEWMTWHITGQVGGHEDMQTAMQQGATCGECGRSGRFVHYPTPAGGTQITLVQTGGPDVPEWMEPKPGREGVTA